MRTCFTLDDDMGRTAQTARTPGNSVGAAISQPKVEVRSCFTLINDIGSTAQTARNPGNSVGVAISQPRVEVRSASTLGIGTKKDSNAVSVAFSRRRYLQQNNGKKGVDDYY